VQQRQQQQPCHRRQQQKQQRRGGMMRAAASATLVILMAALLAASVPRAAEARAVGCGQGDLPCHCRQAGGYWETPPSPLLPTCKVKIWHQGRERCGAHGGLGQGVGRRGDIECKSVPPS
jgi:hypothetical protein